MSNPQQHLDEGIRHLDEAILMKRDDSGEKTKDVSEWLLQQAVCLQQAACALRSYARELRRIRTNH